ncbi:MAG: amino acid permease [Candidatus Omnitrophica bacterium]|nr:amino acid permease [Candidatus Omnitrophota bacterium]MBD3269388.1 amino acid permease [Candidatus Omnitrophota bacterium]
MKKEIKRELGLLDIFCLASGAMISSGIFILPGLAYKEAGPLVFISYFLAGLLALIGTLSIVELATAMPKAGGDYFFITRSLGPLVGTASSFLSWTALCLKSAFAVFGIAEILYLTYGFPILLSAFFICIFFIALNILGVKEAVKFEVILVLALFAIMLFLIVGGFDKLAEANFSPLLPHGFNKLLATSGFVFISFGGLLNIASISGEVKDPSKNIPRGIIFSVLAVTLVYVAILIVTVGVLSGEQLRVSLTPVADTGRILFGKTGYIVISLGALLAFITTANAGIISAARYPLALSEDNLLPAAISKLTKRKKAPAIAISITGVFIFICLLLDLTDLVKLGSVVILTLYISTNIAVIVLREGRVQNYKPAFKVPFYPWINISGIILFIFLIIDMGLVAVEISISLLFLAFMFYFLYGRKRHKIEFALLHLVERVINRRITDNTLEEELKRVIISRDEIAIDRFHELIENSIVLDITKRVNINTFLNIVAKKVADQIALADKAIAELFMEREKDGSTAITPFVAIPHIIIPGSNKFKLVLARCREGIEFTEENDSVKAVFVLFGTKNERAFHLKALSTIAHIVQDPHFEKTWLNAKGEHQLKDIILLSERKRLKT